MNIYFIDLVLHLHQQFTASTCCGVLDIMIPGIVDHDPRDSGS